MVLLMPSLKQIAKLLGLKGFSKMKKDAIVYEIWEKTKGGTDFGKVDVSEAMGAGKDNYYSDKTPMEMLSRWAEANGKPKPTPSWDMPDEGGAEEPKRTIKKRIVVVESKEEREKRKREEREKREREDYESWKKSDTEKRERQEREEIERQEKSKDNKLAMLVKREYDYEYERIRRELEVDLINPQLLDKLAELMVNLPALGLSAQRLREDGFVDYNVTKMEEEATELLGDVLHRVWLRSPIRERTKIIYEELNKLSA